MSGKMVSLRSGDGDRFRVSAQAAKASLTLRTMLDDLAAEEEDEDEIPLPNVPSCILELVCQWLEYHKDDNLGSDESEEEERRMRGCRSQVVFSEWDRKFLDVRKEILFAITLSANYLDIKTLLDMATQTIADTMIKGKNPEEIRKAFNICVDTTPHKTNLQNGDEENEHQENGHASVQEERQDQSDN